MHLLISTTQKQGKRKNDFCFVPEDEILIFASECDGETIDGSCGCRRAMTGIDCGKGTTTMKCADVDITAIALQQKIAQRYIDAWHLDPIKALDISISDAAELIKLASAFPVNSVIEKRGNKFIERL